MTKAAPEPLVELADQERADDQGTRQYEPVRDDCSGLECDVLNRVVRHGGDDGSRSSGRARGTDEERERSGL